MLKKVLVSVALLSFIFATQAFAADVIKLDLNAVYGSTSFHTEGAVKFAELAEKYSGGSVKITVHPSGSLGFKGPELLKAVKDGQVPMSDILMGVVAGSEHVFGVSSLPRLARSFEEAKQLYADMKPEYDKGAKKWKQKMLYAAPWPPSGLVTKNPVNTKADIVNLKTRTYDKNGAVFLQSLGGSPVSLPWGEVYSSLTTGMIDSVLTSVESTENGKLWEVLKEFKSINYAYPLNMVTINLDYWKSLSKSQQEALLKAAAETEAAQWKAAQERHEKGARVIKENGMNVTDETPELTAALDAAANQIVAEYLEKASKDVTKILDRYKK